MTLSGKLSGPLSVGLRRTWVRRPVRPTVAARPVLARPDQRPATRGFDVDDVEVTGPPRSRLGHQGWPNFRQQMTLIRTLRRADSAA